MISIAPRAVQVARYPPGVLFGPHVLRDYEFVWLLSGSARWAVDEPGPRGVRHEHDLRPGTLLLARAGTTDSYAWDPAQVSSHAYVHFELLDRGPLGPDADWPLVRTMEEPLAGLCTYLLGLAGIDSPEARERRDQIVTTLLDVFVRGPLPQVSPPVIPVRLAPAIDLVRREWAGGGTRLMSLAELAAAARMSTGHFSRVFHHEFGHAPAGALELVRLGQAAITLQRSNLGLDGIARLTGFSNAYHFSRRFSAVYGEAPGRFRRRREEADPLWPLTHAGLLALWNALA